MFEHIGILNLSAKCEDFYKEYIPIVKTKIYGYEALDGSLRYGLLLYGENYCAVNVPIGNGAYYNLTDTADSRENQVSSVYNLLLMGYELFDIKIILGFVKERHDDYFESYILTERKNEYSLLKMKLSDIVCLSNIFPLSLFINNDLYENNKFLTKGIIVEE